MVKKALRILYTIGPLTEVNMVLFLRIRLFIVTLFLSDYQLRWWRLPIEERACRKTRLGGGDYQLRISALPPACDHKLLCLQGTIA